jgi:hypothetical protein
MDFKFPLRTDKKPGILGDGDFVVPLEDGLYEPPAAVNFIVLKHGFGAHTA